MDAVPVITCTACAGLTFTLVACPCTSGGNRLLIESGTLVDEAYQDCRICNGIGRVARGCHSCRLRGQCRAQLVITVANLDTGQVASRSVVPGSVPPAPAPGGGWHLALTPLVYELAAAVGAVGLTDLATPRAEPYDISVPLPRGWRPDLPENQRYALESQAIAARSYFPWQVFVGRTVAPPTPEPGVELARLCRIADLLCLDLIVEARRLSWGELAWSIRYEMPGAAVPTETRGYARNLTEAVTKTSVDEALFGLSDRALTAPAYTINPVDRPAPPPIDLDQLERQIISKLGRAAGAQAIWRDGRWWHTRLRVGGTTETLHERDTGQIVQHRVRLLMRVVEPPAPAWLGEPIPHSPCPDCKPGSRLRRCYCTMGSSTPDPNCPGCDGVGLAASTMRCPTCQDSHRIYAAATVTITDLRDRVVHQLWQLGDGEAAALVATQPGGRPVFQLPDRYRLAQWAATFGVRPEDLIEADGGHEIGQDLREGIITGLDSGTDPIGEYVASISRGQPGARVMVLAVPPDVPPLADVIRLAFGFGLGIAVTIEDHRLNAGDPRRVHGQRWNVEIRRSNRPVNDLGVPTRLSVEAAIAYLLEYLEGTLTELVPSDPAEPIPVPQAPKPLAVADPVPLIRRLGHHYSGQPVTVCFERDGCRVYLHERKDVRPLAQAATLADALTVLRLPPL